MLAELLAKQEITEQIYRYCRAMDRMDRELGRKVWHEDGRADYGTIFQGLGSEFITYVNEYHGSIIQHSHQVSNILISVSGEAATSESYVTAALRFADGDRVMQATARGRYLDNWSFRDQRWAVDLRQYVHDFDDRREITEQRLPSGSYRDERDPVYALERQLALEAHG
ncbi:nuclear transport factor 2 family protein [Novosphingobium sp. BL-52-GroH]|uniref:nuclear transport factor 2 family protein n=1 Tax=Novosphingobium sp. BL-52-GroH TaxID=3349877 RepID=UPI00384FD4F6